MNTWKYSIGIDEAGRGPLAGPVAVGVVCITPDFNWSAIPGVDDSKKLTAQKREVIYARALALQTKGLLRVAVGMTDATVIDRIGIVGSIRRAMQMALHEIMSTNDVSPSNCIIKLDGSLKAPAVFLHQETIIQGDAREKVIGLASIAAKVTRDQHMTQLSQEGVYSVYAFEQHKGYGTKAHCDVIRTHGLCDIHRKSFCSKLITPRSVV